MDNNKSVGMTSIGNIGKLFIIAISSWFTGKFALPTVYHGLIQSAGEELWLKSSDYLSNITFQETVQSLPSLGLNISGASSVLSDHIRAIVGMDLIDMIINYQSNITLSLCIYLFYRLFNRWRLFDFITNSYYYSYSRNMLYEKICRQYTYKITDPTTIQNSVKHLLACKA